MVPDYQTLLLPVLRACSGRTISIKDLVNMLADEFDLSEEQREEIVPSGKQTKLYKRVGWAKTYLKKAGLVSYPARGQVTITEKGRKVLQSGLDRIDTRFLEQFDGFREFRTREESLSGEMEDNGDIAPRAPETDKATPDETLHSAYKEIQTVLAAELLDRVRGSSPQFFEHLIVDILSSMGYGGAVADAGRVLGGSGDGGVDGVIDQDPLGLDQVYVQAKRYQADTAVGPSAIREFFGALDLKKAQKGIFFTSTYFSAKARKEAEGLGKRIVLVDGNRLADLMIEHNVRCREDSVLRLNKIDEEFFD